MFKEDDFTIFENKSTQKTIIPPLLEEQEERVKVISRSTPTTKHEIVIPLGVTPTPFQEETRLNAKEYPFPLDDFQRISLTALERDESVLVAAHTSSGKTVVAEYAIAMSLKKKQRVIYTSPIKALSNQKYRELHTEFSDVGLMTGDITLNPQATCLVMTTEILRNMLYRGSEVIREVHWIIFDEIHYMRDKERGVVWEETIVLLPDHVKMVFLSATIPNALEFTSWVSITHKQVVHVVYTDKRVTPLTHFIVPKGGQGLIKVKYFDDEKKRDIFDKSAFLRSLKSLGTKKKIAESDMKNVISILLEEKCLPAIVFSFSRKDCEKFALSVECDFLSENEKESVNLIFKSALSSLRKEDRDLPLIINLLPLLLRGIGIHHSGLLPILKEIVELLFQEGLLKILFATETFSIGLNMPAKCVIFTAINKFDGNERRILTAGEYIQMSGRAGRRGIDPKGVVILMLGEEITAFEGSELLSGQPDKLNSAFRLGYNMILNLTRVEGLDPLFLLSRSFFHFQKINERISLFNFLEDLFKKIPERPLEGNYIFQKYLERTFLKKERQKELNDKFVDLISRGSVVDLFFEKDNVPFLVDNAIVNYFTSEKVEVTYYSDGGLIKKTFPLESLDKVYKGKVRPEIRNFLRNYEEHELKSTFDFRIKVVEDEIMSYRGSISFEKCLLCTNLSKSCVKSCRFIDSFNRYLNSEEDSSFFHNYFAPHKEIIVEHFRVEKIHSIYRNNHSEYQKLVEIYHMAECQKMLNVLKKLNYCDDRSILAKGKIACEISSGHELILTEMIFNGEFSKMELEDVIALLSCFIFEEWQQEEVDVSDQSMNCYKVLRNTALKVVEVLNESNLEIDPDTFLRKFSYEIMDVVRLWVCGHTFGEICSKTTIFEGSIIRCFRRLEELLRQMCSAARVIGNVELENLFAIGITKIKRDIVFAGSLYL